MYTDKMCNPLPLRSPLSKCRAPGATKERRRERDSKKVERDLKGSDGNLCPNFCSISDAQKWGTLLPPLLEQEQKYELAGVGSDAKFTQVV